MIDPSAVKKTSDAVSAQRAKDAENRLAALTSLLESVDDSAQATALVPASSDSKHESRLAMARLGMASSLFVALRAKHPATAKHSLRVALGVSSWALAVGLPPAQRDAIEVAALLHDVGKIGVPDHVLLKPGKLSGEEVLLMERHRHIGREILSGCCSSPEIMEILNYNSAWYNGSKHGFDKSGADLPVGSRMLAIVDAFDAMTTDHIYRPAKSRERAVAELFEHAGTQFDPNLTKDFCSLLSGDQVRFNASVASRWLGEIEAGSSDRFWSLQAVTPAEAIVPDNLDYQQQLLESMLDGVIFVNERLDITMWNRAAERLTGIDAESILGSKLAPSLLCMRDDRQKLMLDENCPVFETLGSGVQSLRRVSVGRRKGESVSIDMHIAPVLKHDGVARGAVILLHDASSQVTLEARVQTLHEKATRDPLTKVGNRAEFDRLLPLFIKEHLEEGASCAMIICDIDHFKKINDTYGHQAGDDALMVFASLLTRHARAGDLVARYGGEEFVILCAGCDNATATRRAEELCKATAQHPMPSLNGTSFTASFGVTEVQGGDTPETFLNRADRALLQAKDNGRNMVVQLGSGIVERDVTSKPANWLNWFAAAPGEELISRSLLTVVPLKVAAEKMRGFVADHHAQIIAIDDNRVTLKIDGQDSPLVRRRGDRAVPFVIELTFQEKSDVVAGRQGGAPLQTIIHVTVRPKKQRDRRRRDVSERARQLVVSLKSYLMAHDYTEEKAEPADDEADFLRKSTKILSYWLTN